MSGLIFGIASTNAVIGQEVEICTEGVFALNKAAGATKIGVVADAALAGDATVNVRLNGTF
jgi:predicted RecA/RadA family phage recombinase